MIDEATKISTSTAPFSTAVPIRSDIPPAVLDALRGELASDEHVVWLGQPLAMRRFVSMLPVWLIGVPWTAVPAFVFVELAEQQNAAALFLLPFLLAGLALLALPWQRRWFARHTLYAVTNKGLLVVERRSAGVHFEWHCFALPHTAIERRRRNDGSGTLIFERFVDGSGRGRRMIELGFKDIDDVAAVEAVIQRTFGTSGGTP